MHLPAILTKSTISERLPTDSRPIHDRLAANATNTELANGLANFEKIGAAAPPPGGHCCSCRGVVYCALRFCPAPAAGCSWLGAGAPAACKSVHQLGSGWGPGGGARTDCACTSGEQSCTILAWPVA